MEKVLNSYETLFVVDCTLGEESVKAIVDKFTTLINDNATEVSVDEWGKRRLAYAIDYKNDGYYVLVNFKSEGSFTLELERVFGITEGVIRNMTLAVEAKAEASETVEEIAVEETVEVAETTEA